jgi:hypothetical protein
MPYEALPINYGNYAFPAGSTPGIDYSTSDPRSMARTNWLASVNDADRMNQYLRDYTADQRTLSDYWAMQAANSYGSMVPGYTQDEMGNIIREDELKGAMTTPGQYDAMYLTPSEQEGMMGDVNPYRTVNTQGLWDLTTTGNTEMQRATGELGQGLTGAVGQHAGLYAGAADPSKLALSSAYTPQVEADLGEGADALRSVLAGGSRDIRSTIDPNKLSLSGEFTSNYNLTPEMQQEMVNQAGRTVGSRFATLRDEAARRAMQQGNTSPMAVAAITERLNAQEAGTAGDVMAKARLDADIERANRLMTEEQMRLAAEKGIQAAKTGVESGLMASKLGTEQDLMKTTLGARQDTEKLRLGSEQTLSQQIMQKAAELGTSYEEAAKIIGAANVAAQKDVRDTGLATEKYITDTTSSQAQAADKAATDRASTIALNRQGVSQYIPAQQWGQGSAANEMLSSRYTGGATARRADEAEKRGYETGSRDYYGNQAAAGLGMQTDMYGKKQEAAQGATGQYLKYDADMAAQPKWWEKVAGIAIGAANAYSGGEGFKKSDGGGKGGVYGT